MRRQKVQLKRLRKLRASVDGGGGGERLPRASQEVDWTKLQTGTDCANQHTLSKVYCHSRVLLLLLLSLGREVTATTQALQVHW